MIETGGLTARLDTFLLPEVQAEQPFWKEINQVACGLIAKGVKKGDKLLIHAENCPEMMIAWYASARD